MSLSERFNLSGHSKKVKEIENEDSNFKDKNFPNKSVIKVNKSSYIITIMESLAQIKCFSIYFINKKIKKEDYEIAGYFKDYMENLWSDKDEKFIPKDFMKQYLKIRKDNDLLKNELEPFEFYDFILEQLNKELYDRDKAIKDYYNKFEENYKGKQDETLEKFIQNYIKKYNSIVSKTFYGIMKNYSCCDMCPEDEKTNYMEFRIIDLNINDFLDCMYLKGNSLTNFSVEELIEYYFEEKKGKSTERECPYCKKKCGISIGKKIVELPNYLVFRINWGKFEPDKGFSKNNYIIPSYEYLDVDETIEMKEKYFNNDVVYNDLNRIENPVKFNLLSTIGYFIYNNENDIKDRNNNKLIFICKYKRKEDGKWINFWCNNKVKEKSTYTDDFTTPCFLFYEKNSL